MTTVNDFVDILRIIREQPEWGDALRSALLSRELLEMPQTLAEFAKATNARLAALEEDVADLKAGQARLEESHARLEERQIRLEEGQTRLEESHARLERSFAKLDGDVGNLKGDACEIKLGRNIDTIIGQRLGLRRVRILKGSLLGNNTAYMDLMDLAEDRGDINQQEREDVNNTDYLLTGRNPSDASDVYVVVEVSVTAGDSDINRAAVRAATLVKATGDVAVPTVVCTRIDDARIRLAQELDVAVITYGE